MNPAKLMLTPFSALFADKGIYKATYYFSPTLVIKATTKRYDFKLPKSNGKIGVVLTMGKPNYKERIFIAKKKKAGAAFPLREVEVKYSK